MIFKNGMLVMLVSTEEIERVNNSKSPIPLNSLGRVVNDPDEVGCFEVMFNKTRLVCISKMVRLVIDQKLRYSSKTAMVKLP